MDSYFCKNYHGIFFTSPIFDLGRINFDKNETKGDRIAKFSEFYISDANIAYLKEMQKKSNTDQREYGGLVSMNSTNRELFFEDCTWCIGTPVSLSGVLNISQYPNYKDKSFVSSWHTHLDQDNDESQTPSGLMRAINFHDYTGDFFLFTNQYFVWQGSELGAGASAENTWMLPGRIGIIAGELGITIFRFVGDYYQAKSSPTGYLSCLYHPKNVCYSRQGTIENLDMQYSWIRYNLSEIKP